MKKFLIVLFTMLTLLALSSLSFASTSGPSIANCPGDYKIGFYDKSGNYFVYSKSVPIVRTDSVYSFKGCIGYSWTNNTWISSGNVDSDFNPSYYNYTIYAASYDVKNSDGTVFFRQPIVQSSTSLPTLLLPQVGGIVSTALIAFSILLVPPLVRRLMYSFSQ